MLKLSSILFAVSVAAALMAAPSAAQVVDVGKYPNLKGQWVRPFDGNPNNWARLGGKPPLTAASQKIWNGIIDDLAARVHVNWPSHFYIHMTMQDHIPRSS